MARRQVHVDDWEQLHCCQLRCVRLTIHQPLNHLDNLLAQVLDIDLLKDALDTRDRLMKRKDQ